MLTATEVKKRLRDFAIPEKAEFYPRFFKTGKGEYGEGDRFIGVTVPSQRKVAREFSRLPLKQIKKLLDDVFHECRLTAILILVNQFEKSNESGQKTIYEFYLQHLNQVNNWDLVDSSAHKIIGAFLDSRPRDVIYQLARKDHLWSQRIAIVSTYWYIRKGQFKDTIAVADLLLEHPHDLIHKAVGWMLREIGKKNESVLVVFLKKRYTRMPRTMLRYAIEKLDKNLRSQFLKGRI